MLASIPHKLALHVSRPDFASFQAFAITVLSAQPVYEEPGLAACQLPGGGVLELYDPAYGCPPHLFAHGALVASFLVADVGRAAAQAQATGLHMASGPHELSAGLAYCHVRLPGGLLLGLYQERPAGEAAHKAGHEAGVPTLAYTP